jgi:hypothetical protein
MKMHQFIWVVMFLALGMSWAQNDSGQQPAENGQQPAESGQQPTASGQQPNAVPAPAFGQDNSSPQSSDNPPISGLDQPSLEPRGVARSYLIPGAHVSEAVDTNVNTSAGRSAINGVTRALGSLTLQKLWSRYDAALDYVGGGAFYTNHISRANQLHQLDADQRLLWRTGQLAIRDSFSYLPEGSFGYGSYGGTGAAAGLAGGGLTGGGFVGGGIGNNFFGPGQFASLGQQPRITNVALADITESLNPRSSVTLAGSYGLVHFINSGFGIDSRQTSAQAGYNYQLNRKDQIGLIYGFQEFRYPSSIGSSFKTNLVNLLYGHRISGRMDLVLGGGPQLTQTHFSCPPASICSAALLGTKSRLSGSGRAMLRYRFPKTSVGLYYDHYNSSGSGFFVGASSDIARLDVTRPIGRVWTGTVDVGYSHNNRLVPNPTGLGIAALSYNYLYAGGAVRRQLGRDFGLSLSYQFNNLGFDSTFCGTTGAPCSRTSQRHVAAVGLDWHPHPIRLD